MVVVVDVVVEVVVVVDVVVIRSSSQYTVLTSMLGRLRMFQLYVISPPSHSEVQALRMASLSIHSGQKCTTMLQTAMAVNKLAQNRDLAWRLG